MATTRRYALLYFLKTTFAKISVLIFGRYMGTSVGGWIEGEWMWADHRLPFDIACN
jgi:hypothetical protein